YFTIKIFAVYLFTQWVKGTFPRIRVDQMMIFAWKVLVPLVLVLILWQMLAMKLFDAQWLQLVAIFIGNIVAVGYVLNVMSKYLKSEQIRTKRAFTPKSLVGTMEPISSTSSGD
ncbi:MAG: NADH-quinone oxidoreductase subunit H, partial [Caldilineaceae bacterium]|nr:NADH-quinone oxidoreductase subunit H [Caldilineaceae bacterium]